MTLFISDMHLGRYDPARNKQEEADLVACLEHFRDQLKHLVLVGDVFDQYIEYRHLVPKGFVRFQALLASFTDNGIRVSYLLGNHDPWHVDYFRKELGVETFPDELVFAQQTHKIYTTHGDQVYSRFPLSQLITYLMRNPLMVSLYRGLLPGDLGMAIAARAKSFLHSDIINQKVTEKLCLHAKDLLQAGKADLVVMGHSHVKTIEQYGNGLYLNPGCWYLDKTFGVLENKTVKLVRWEHETPNVFRSKRMLSEVPS